jgi:hypothetical protein
MFLYNRPIMFDCHLTFIFGIRSIAHAALRDAEHQRAANEGRQVCVCVCATALE